MRGFFRPKRLRCQTAAQEMKSICDDLLVVQRDEKDARAHLEKRFGAEARSWFAYGPGEVFAFEVEED